MIDVAKIEELANNEQNRHVVLPHDVARKMVAAIRAAQAILPVVEASHFVADRPRIAALRAALLPFETKESEK